MSGEPRVEDIYNLTPLQHGLLFHGLYGPRSGAYWQQLRATFGSNLDPVVFHESWRQMVARHAALRTSFHWEELDEPLQVVQPDVGLPWEEMDWRSLDPAHFEDRLRELLAKDRDRGFQWDEPPLMRFYLICGPDRRFTFLWSHHHILLDGWSGALVFADLAATYQAAAAGRTAQPPRPRPFRDYVLWLQQQDRGRAMTFWRDYMHSVAPTRVRIGETATAAATAPERFRRATLALPASAAIQLQNFARQQRLTLSVVVQGAWSLLLSHYSGQFDVVFGMVVSGRSAELPGVETMVGMLANTIPVRLQFDAGQDVSAWLHDLQTAQVERDRHAHVSLADMLSASGLPADVPLFDSILSFENYPVEPVLDDDRSELYIERLEAFEQTNYPLAVVVSPGDGALTVKITADADRFDEPTVERMLWHYRNLMVAIAQRPLARLVDLTLETPVVAPLARLPIAGPPPDTASGVFRWFESQAARTPDATAVICEKQMISYRELNARSNRLARFLRDQGIGPNHMVGICASCSLDMVVALLGVMKAGGAYVPLDPDYPVDRLRFMVADAGLSLVLMDAFIPAALRQALLADAPTGVRVVDLQRDRDQFANYAADDLNDDSIASANLAYMIYTSGSTGRPKGVVIEHRSLVNHMQWMLSQFSFDASVRVLQKTPFSFDASVWEFFLPLMCGGELVVAGPDGHRDVDYLIRTIGDHQITVLQGVPSLLQALVAHPDFSACSSLTHIFSGGEVLTPSLARRLRQRSSAVLCNLYGPTEACIDATFYICPKDADWAGGDSVPIGRPIANTFARVRDAWGHEAPMGVAGELCIGGLGLARQYWRQPQLTAEKFVFDPADRRRLYRTGDLVQQLCDGTLIFLGRIDHQVKLFGYRIELGEVESVLQQHPDVDRAAVVLRTDAAGNQRLTAFVTSRGDPDTLQDSIRSLLKSFLPHYMIPAQCLVLDEFPLTPSGKIDRGELSARRLSPSAAAATYAAPESEPQRRLVKIWEEVLERKPIGIHDNFFQLGAHSLKATQVLSRIRDAFQIKLPLRVLFDLPTVFELAQRIETYQAAHDASRSAATEDGAEMEDITL